MLGRLDSGMPGNRIDSPESSHMISNLGHPESTASQSASPYASVRDVYSTVWRSPTWWEHEAGRRQPVS